MGGIVRDHRDDRLEWVLAGSGLSLGTPWRDHEMIFGYGGAVIVGFCRLLDRSGQNDGRPRLLTAGVDVSIICGAGSSRHADPGFPPACAERSSYADSRSFCHHWQMGYSAFIRNATPGSGTRPGGQWRDFLYRPVFLIRKSCGLLVTAAGAAPRF